MLQLLGIILATTLGLASPAVSLTTSTDPDPVQVLGEWDADRASAYAVADADALVDLYAPGSTAGTSDAALLGDYAGRGLTVWMRTQVFSADVRSATEHTMTLRVTDRTVTVVGDSVRCRALPASVPVTRQLGLARLEGRWLMESVSPVRQPSAAAKTSVTSWSAKS